MTETIRFVSQGEAQRLTERIKLTIESVDNSLIKLRNLIEEAQSSNTWQVLGFASWTAYVASLFDGRKVALAREDRQALTTMLADQGMSTRAIAPIVGASQRTVANDVSNSAHLESETPKVTGLDGKTYAPAEQKERRRRPIPDQAREAAWKALKAVESLERVTADDRFEKNHRAVRELTKPEVNRLISSALVVRRRLENGGDEFPDAEEHIGTTVLIGILANIVSFENITPEQASAAVGVLERIGPFMQRAAQRTASV